MINNIYVKVSLLFGSICTILIILYFFAFYFFGANPLMHMSRFDLVIVLICATFAIVYYRNFLNAGKLHFGEALIIGQSVNFIGSLISTVVIYVFIAFVDTKVISRHVNDLQSLLVSGRQQMEEDLRGEAFENILRNVLATTPSDVALDLFIKKFLVCLVLIGIIGAFLRKI